MIPQLHRPIAGRLRGAWTALITPFAGDRLDLDTLRALIEHQIESGVEGLLACGSTGEVLSLTDDEYRRVLRTAVECAGGRVPVMAGTGISATAATSERIRIAHELGADIALVITPPCTTSTLCGIVAHMEAIAATTPLPIVLANVPGDTSTGVSPETIVRLSRVPGILGVMEASGDVERVGFIARHANPGFAIFAGSDALTLPVMALGAAGVISVAGNVAPATISALTAASRGDLVEARRLQLSLVDLNRSLDTETDPIPVKAAAALLGFGTGDVRLPLTAATTGTIETLNRALRTIDETAQALRRSRPEMRPTI